MLEKGIIQEEIVAAILDYDDVVFKSDGVEEKSFKTKDLSLIVTLITKAIPVPPAYISLTHEGRVGNCPTCKILISENTADVFGKKMNICICGQKIYWPQRTGEDIPKMLEITKEMVIELRNKTGSGMMECKRALEYARAHHDERLAVAYLRARTLAVATPNLTFDERVLRFL